MSTHSYPRLWAHLIWETLNREPMLDKRAAAKASAFAWGGGYGAFSVSHSDVERVVATSPIRKNIIASGRMPKNTSCLLSGMVWNGALRKTIEMVGGR